jgi:uncharacterized RmlC-like cupin family protein
MNVATIPPGGVAYAHIHVGLEVMLYMWRCCLLSAHRMW